MFSDVSIKLGVVHCRYGAVVLNSMGLLGFIFAPLTWGGFAGRSSLADVQSGLGVVHNSFMIDNVQKSVLKVPEESSSK
jgi:aldehyde dehydrogenase (NAD(P)+)